MPNLTIPARHRVRRDIANVAMRNYWANKGEAIAAFDVVLQKHNMTLDMFDCPDDEGRTSVRILALAKYKLICTYCTDGSDTPAFDNVLSFSWYRMPSGKYEINAYIS